MTAITCLPVAALAVSILAYFQPQLLNGYADAIVPLLGVIMFCMGLTLTTGDFRRVILRPGVVLLGIFMQFLCMPLLAWLIGMALQLPPALLAGMVLLGACPGGTASNLVCYLARGDVALSISMTCVSTLLAVVLTPWLTWIYVDESIVVPVAGMMLSLLKIIILPVILGLIINRYAARYLVRLNHVLPFLTLVAIVLIIGIIVSLNQSRMPDLLLPLLLAVILHNSLGLMLGYLFPAMLGIDSKTCRTLAIEVGMQNSGLAVALANVHFSSLASLPGALFSIWHNISGAVLASYWSAADARYACEVK